MKRVCGHLLDEGRPTDGKPGLRSSEDLVAAERDDIGAEGDSLTYNRFLWQAEAAQVDERAAAEVLHDGHSPFSPDGHQLGKSDLRNEADDPVVARVHFQQ